MTMSQYYRTLREHVGGALLLMPAVAAIVRDSIGRILVQQKHDGTWSLPAGAVEPGESPAQAVIREVMEETGLVVTPTKIRAVLGGPSCRVRYANQDEVEYVVTVFECAVLGGGLLDEGDETKQLAYFPPESLPDLAFQYPRELFSSAAGEALF